jgi:malate/lactate dehydrogenase
MIRFAAAFSIAIAVPGQFAFAKNRLTDPIKIARDCKSEVELFCKAVRPGGQRIVNCLRGKTTELSPACSAAFRSAE